MEKKIHFEIKQYMKDQTHRVDQYLETLWAQETDSSDTLLSSMKYSLSAGGKRLRPLLVIAGAQACGYNQASILPVAVSTELIHTYSLIHDDLPSMDDDDLRRGKPTNHIVYGEGMAVLAGDGLLTYAFELLSKADEFSDSVRVRLIQTLAQASGANGMVGGQAEDLMNAGKTCDPKTLEKIHLKKTAALIQASVSMGAIAANAEEITISKLKLFGQKIGLAFQIIDDILDEISDSKTLGKSIGKDILQEKMTFPSIYGLETSQKMANDYVQEALALIQPISSSEALKELALFITTRRY